MMKGESELIVNEEKELESIIDDLKNNIAQQRRRAMLYEAEANYLKSILDAICTAMKGMDCVGCLFRTQEGKPCQRYFLGEAKDAALAHERELANYGHSDTLTR